MGTVVLAAGLGFSVWARRHLGSNEWRGLVALALALLAFARKSTAEEERMRQTFPEYEQYQRETAALIPFVY